MTSETKVKRVKKVNVDVMPTMVSVSIYSYDNELKMRYIKDAINHIPNTLKIETILDSESRLFQCKVLTVKCNDNKWYQLEYNELNEVVGLLCQYEKVEITFGELPDYIKDAINKSNSVYVDKVYSDNEKHYYLHLDQYYDSLSSYMISNISKEVMFNILIENNRFILRF